jgi:uncharacterized protein YkwD
MFNLSYFLNHLLLPGYSNNQKAKILHSESIFILILFLIFGQLFINYFPEIGIRVLGYASQISPDEVIRLTNEKRTSAGVSALTYNAQLATAAKAKGEDMLAKDYWAHVAPDGTQPWKFFNDVGYKYKYAGENLAKDFSSPQAAIDAWMASPSHKENLLSSKYSEIGIAVVEGDMNGVDTTIIVQLFGTRYTGSIASVTSNVSAKSDQPIKENVSLKPTSMPSPTPTAVPTIIETSNNTETNLEKIALTNEKTTSKPTPIQVLVSPFTTKKGFSALTTSVLLITFGIDSIYLAKRKITRVGGRTLAHIAFLGMILAIVVIIQAGDILPPITDIIK